MVRIVVRILGRDFGCSLNQTKSWFFLHFWLIKDIFEWSNPHFSCCTKQEKTRFFLHFSVKNDIFEWSNPHFRCKSQQKRVFSLKKWRKIRIFALKIVFWLYILKKWSYGLLNIIFEKFIFRDQIHILGAKINQNVFLIQNWRKNQDFCIENRFLALYA